MEVTNLYGPPTQPILSSKNFYQQYQAMGLYIKSIDKTIESLQKELDNLIRQSGPINVRAVTYDTIPGVSIKVPDIQVLERISVLRVAISINKTNLKEWKENLEDLKKEATKKARNSNADIVLKVFVAAWFEGKSNHEIAEELGYSVGRIWNVKVEINQLLRIS